MSEKNSPLEALMEFPKDGSDVARRELLRRNTDALVTAPDRYSAKQNEYFDLMFSRTALIMDWKLRRCLALGMARTKVDKDHVKNFLGGKNKAIGLILRRSTTHTIPDLANIIRERAAALFDGPRLKSIGAEELQDGHRYTLPKLLLEDTYMFIYHSLRQASAEFSSDALTSMLDKTATRFRSEIIEQSQTEARKQLLTEKREVAERERDNELTEDYVADLLMTENRTGFILALSTFLKIDNITMQRVLNDASWESLAICCRAADMSRQSFANIINCMNRRRSDHAYRHRIVKIYSKIPVDAAERVMRFWQIRAVALSEAAEQGQHNVPGSDPAPGKPDQESETCATVRRSMIARG